MSKISYSAIVLDDKSREKLLSRFKKLIPDGWEIIVHHMTINLGEIDPEFERFLGMSVRLSVNDFAIDNMICAVGVSGFESNNKKPHITLGVNRLDGGKPYMSNNLTNWEKIKRPFFITGKVTEVEYI